MSARLLAFLLAALPALAAASTVNRCEDLAGNITFTHLSCPAGHERRLQEAYNAPPGSNTGLLPPADRSAHHLREAPGKMVKDLEILVVGEQEDGCGNRLSPEQRRKAMINRQTPPGMTRQDVENLLGRPDTIANRSGELHYTYRSKNGRSDSVTFDQYGCVKERRERH